MGSKWTEKKGPLAVITQPDLFDWVAFIQWARSLLLLFTSLRCLLRKKGNFICLFCGQCQLRVKTEKQRNRTEVIAGALRGNVGSCSPALAALIPPLSGELTVMFVISWQMYFLQMVLLYYKDFIVLKKIKKIWKNLPKRFYFTILHSGLKKVSLLLSPLQKFHVH